MQTASILTDGNLERKRSREEQLKEKQSAAEKNLRKHWARKVMGKVIWTPKTREKPF